MNAPDSARQESTRARRQRMLGAGGLLALSLSAFGIFGLWAGFHTVLLADLSQTLGLSPGPLGVALFAGAAASIAAMASLGWTADLMGRRAFLLATTCVFGAGVAGLALAENFWAFVLVLVFLSPATGLYDVGINAAAVDLEKLSGRHFMSFLHAVYSAGAVAGAVVAGALLSVDLDYRLVYLSLLIPLSAMVCALAFVRFPRLPGAAHGGISPDVPDAGDAVEQEGADFVDGRRGPYRSVPLLLVAGVAAMGLLAEGQLGNWSGIYLRDSLGIGALLGGSGVAVFYAAMAAGRFATGWVVGRLGNRGTLRASGLLITCGMTLALVTTLPPLVVGGFMLVGLAVAGVVPVAYSVAGDLAPSRAGAAVSVVSTFGYGGFLIGPPLVGGLAELIDLRVALGIVAVAGLGIFCLSLAAAQDQAKRAPS